MQRYPAEVQSPIVDKLATRQPRDPTSSSSLSRGPLRLFSPLAQAAIGAYSFLIFTAICLLTTIYIYVVIPETKGKTFVEINRIFAKRNGVEIPEEEKEAEAGPPAAAAPPKETTF